MPAPGRQRESRRTPDSSRSQLTTSALGGGQLSTGSDLCLLRDLERVALSDPQLKSPMSVSEMLSFNLE